MVKLRLFASLRELAGAKIVEVEADDLPIPQVLRRLSDRLGEEARQILFDAEGDLWPSVILLVNGESPQQGTETRVASGDEVAVLLPTAGG